MEVEVKKNTCEVCGQFCEELDEKGFCSNWDCQMLRLDIENEENFFCILQTL